MKSTITSAIAGVLLGGATFGQAVAPVAPEILTRPHTDGNTMVRAGAAPGVSDAARFNLNFPGGKVREFVGAVAKARGKPVNVIIPQGTEATVIPPVDVFGVTVSALFRALSSASKRQIPVSPGFPGQYSESGFSFLSGENDDSPETVWTFQVMPPPELTSEEPISPPRAVQYYPVAEYLSHFTVEDITTAIESGWRLQGGDSTKDSLPILRFHEETKLLICAGASHQLEVIPQVLTGLGRLLGQPRTDHLKITRKAGAIVVPRVEFREASVPEAIEFIRKKALDFDPEKKGINILLNEVNGPADQKLTFHLVDTSVLELLKFTAELGRLNFEIRDAAIVLSTAGTTNAPGAGVFGGVSPGAPPIPGISLPGSGIPAGPNPAIGSPHRSSR